jgi:hypothetical protein
MKIGLVRSGEEQSVIEKALRAYYPDAEFVVINPDDGKLRGVSFDSVVIDEFGSCEDFFK